MCWSGAGNRDARELRPTQLAVSIVSDPASKMRDRAALDEDPGPGERRNERIGGQGNEAEGCGGLEGVEGGAGEF